MQLSAIFRKSPFSRLLFFYAGGIVASCFFQGAGIIVFSSFSFILILLLVLLLWTVNRQAHFHTGWQAGFFAGVLLFIAGFINMEIRHQRAGKEKTRTEVSKFMIFHIIDSPEIRTGTVKSTARIKWSRVGDKWARERQKLMLLLEKDTLSMKLKPGDWLLAYGRIAEIPRPGNPGEFDYGKYLENRNIYKQIYLRSGCWKISAYHKGRTIKSISGQIQGNLLRSYRKIGLEPALYGMLSALTLGYRDDLDVHTKQAFSRAGVMHVMALSGFNVVIIVLALGYVLDIFTRTASGKVGKTAIIILIIWSFAFVTGLSSSVTRATLMISLVMTGRLFNRNINTYNILFASAFFLLAISPALLTDVSFQLSFAAVTGILIYQPVAYRLLRFNNTLAARIWQMFTVTFAAQLSTLPFTLYYFHQFPVYFWLTNLYVIPWVSLIIILAGIYLLVSFLHPLALVTGNILELLLEGLYDAVKLTDRLPCALVENIYISIHQMILFFALTLFLGFFMLHRKNLFLMLTLSLFLIFQIISVTRNLNISHQQIFMVGNLKNRSAIGLISGRNGMMWINPNVSSGDNALQYAFLNFWIERGVSDQLHVLSDIELARDGIPGTESCCCLYPWLGQNLIMECNGWRIACIQDDQFFKHPFPSRLNLDLVVVSGRVKINPQGIKEWFDAKWIILDSSVSTYRASRWKKSCDWFCVPCWIVAEQGAFLLRLNKKGKVSKVNLSDSLPDDLGN